MAGETGRVVKVDKNDFIRVENDISSNPYMLTSGGLALRPEWLEPKSCALELHNKLFKMKSKMANLLVEASYEGDAYLVDEMISIVHTVPVDAENQNMAGMTALHMACRNGHTDIVNMLLARGADLEKQDSKGRTCVHHAVKVYSF